MNFVSDKIKKIGISKTVLLNTMVKDMIKKEKDIINLTVGEPDFNTPNFIKDAAKFALKKEKTKYTPVDGTDKIKEEIIKKYLKYNNLLYNKNEIIVSNGAKQCIYNALQSLINPNDEVILQKPYWVSYPDMISLSGGKPIFLHTDIKNNFKISINQLENAISKKTKMIILNSPSNPSGAVYSLDELKKISQLLVKYPNIFILSDDIYENINFSEEKIYNIINANNELKDRTILINGVSKSYSMTGWRIGYAAAHHNIISSMKKIQSQSTSNACSISQYAAAIAIEKGEKYIEEKKLIYKKRFSFIYNLIKNINGIKIIKSYGAFYIFPNIKNIINASNIIKDDIEFCNILLKKFHVACVPGTYFGIPYHIRLSFAVDEKKLFSAVQKLKKCIDYITK